jgi:tRNA G18 (ribose-2'-O)-methylase SpoU
MMRRATVERPDDQRLDGLRGLRDPDLRRSTEASHGTFVAEGVAVVERLARSGYPVLQVVVAPEREAAVVAALRGADGLEEVPLLVVARPVLDGVVGFPVHRGVLALGARRPVPDLGGLDPSVRTVVVLEHCNDHENMGAIARSAWALGAGALVLSPRCADPLYRRCVRVSMGQVLHLDLVRVRSWPGAIAALGLLGFTTLALTPAADAVVLDQVAVDADERVALVLGAEGPGLTDGALEAAGRRVRIPIRIGVDSLNVGHAAAVALHHVAAARRAAVASDSA